VQAEEGLEGGPELIPKKLSQIFSTLLCVSLFAGVMMPLPAAAIEPEPVRPEISLNDAISRALSNSKEVLKAQKEIERTEALKEQADAQLDYIPTYAPGTALVEVPWANMMAADLTWQMSRKSADATVDATALSTCKKYWDVIRALEKVEVARLGVKSANQQRAIAMLSQSVGIISPINSEQVNLKLIEAEANLANAENELENAYAVFNQAIGLNPWDRPILTDDEIVFTPLEIENLQTEISRVKATSPSLWLAQEKVTMQKYLKDMMFYTGEYSPYKARKIELEQAELDAMSAEQMYETIVRSLYYTILSLEESAQIAGEAVKLAEESLRLAKLRYDLGMAIRADVTAAEQELAQARSNYNELVVQHTYMKLAFEKPWAHLAQQ